MERGLVVRPGWMAFQHHGPLKTEVYPIPLRDRLPVIRVPLRVTDHDVTLRLQKLVNHCYANGRY